MYTSIDNRRSPSARLTDFIFTILFGTILAILYFMSTVGLYFYYGIEGLKFFWLVVVPTVSLVVFILITYSPFIISIFYTFVLIVKFISSGESVFSY